MKMEVRFSECVLLVLDQDYIGWLLVLLLRCTPPPQPKCHWHCVHCVCFRLSSSILFLLVFVLTHVMVSISMELFFLCQLHATANNNSNDFICVLYLQNIILLLLTFQLALADNADGAVGAAAVAVHPLVVVRVLGVFSVCCLRCHCCCYLSAIVNVLLPSNVFKDPKLVNVQHRNSSNNTTSNNNMIILPRFVFLLLPY